MINSKESENMQKYNPYFVGRKILAELDLFERVRDANDGYKSTTIIEDFSPLYYTLNKDDWSFAVKTHLEERTLWAIELDPDTKQVSVDTGNGLEKINDKYSKIPEFIQEEVTYFRETHIVYIGNNSGKFTRQANSKERTTMWLDEPDRRAGI